MHDRIKKIRLWLIDNIAYLNLIIPTQPKHYDRAKPNYYIMSRNETKKTKIKIDDVFAQMGDGNKKYISAVFLGEEVNLGTLNIRMHFHKGVDCIAKDCTAKGAYFKMERSPGPPHILYSQWHLNLYAIDDAGKEVLMTKDHRHPKSKGGQDTLENLDPMCTVCNAKKGDNV